jgi:hypothetical protein
MTGSGWLSWRGLDMYYRFLQVWKLRSSRMKKRAKLIRGQLTLHQHHRPITTTEWFMKMFNLL